MISSPKKESLESAEFFVVINLLLTRVSGGSRQQYPFYQPPRRFSRGFPEFQYHREIRGHLKRSAKYGDFALRVQGRNRHSREAYKDGDKEENGLRLVPWGQGFRDMGPAI